MSDSLFEPHSLNTVVAILGERLDNQDKSAVLWRKDVKDWIGAVQKSIDLVALEVKAVRVLAEATNGRVTALEYVNKLLKSKAVFVAGLAASLISTVAWILINLPAIRESVKFFLAHK